MAQEDAVAETASQSQSPYQLDPEQTHKACSVLKVKINEPGSRKKARVAKPDLLESDYTGSDHEGVAGAETPLWLIVTTKKHIVDEKRLKPNKVLLPHPFNTDTSSTICLLTADPQSLYKNAIQDPSFPDSLRSRITNIVDVSTLKSKYKSFESRRQLLAEHDIFLADDRIITVLPRLLGKTFYKAGSKRPVPIGIAGPKKRDEDGKKIRKRPEEKKIKDEANRGAAKPEAIAREIEKALSSALVHLAPGTSTAVKIGIVSQEATMLSSNVDAVVNAMTQKYITKGGWRNVRAIHIKGPNTMALPIWLASELWVDDADILGAKKTFGKKKPKLLEGPEASPERIPAEASSVIVKRKADETETPTAVRNTKKKRVEKKHAGETASRKKRLRREKEIAMGDV